MKSCDVGLVAEFGEQAGFGGSRIYEEAEGLVTVTGEDHMIEILRFSRGRHDGDAARSPDDARGGLAQPQAVAEWNGDFIDVGFRAAVDRPPLVLSGKSEEAVVMEKPKERSGGKGEHLCRWSAPDSGAHGDEI